MFFFIFILDIKLLWFRIFLPGNKSSYKPFIVHFRHSTLSFLHSVTFIFIQFKKEVILLHNLSEK